MKKYLPFDSGTLFIPTCERWKKEAITSIEQEYLGDMLRIHTIAHHDSLLFILRYFGLDPVADADRAFDLIGDIQMQVYEEMLALTGEEYRLDWSRHDGAFCLWYRDRNHCRDATRDLMFVRTHTRPLFPDAEIRNSPVHGFGLFSLRHWSAGETLCNRLDGQVLSYDEYEQLRLLMAPMLGRVRNFFFMEWNALPGGRLLSRPFRTTYSYINHSEKPNLQLSLLDERLSLVAIRDVRPGDEFTLDYRLESLPRGYFDTPSSGYLTPVVHDPASMRLKQAEETP
ncbi:SET domain-containing protein-lysine N-methyltransferase [Acidithiobacillus thiooxidans]|uniref:SET domain-containing protein-lysine N-methyltransferase n=1 Tax=Acidithiobacillus thiooxidans TaxID=930 RepID=UPI0004E0D4D6|nr:SET domain-containing protein [Acidithiobacillus thiooxidans]